MGQESAEISALMERLHHQEELLARQADEIRAQQAALSELAATVEALSAARRLEQANTGGIRPDAAFLSADTGSASSAPPVRPNNAPAAIPVTTDNGTSLTFGGRFRTTFLASWERPIGPGTVFYLLPSESGESNTTDLNARPSMLSAQLNGPTWGPFRIGGAFSAQFTDRSVIADAYGFLPIVAYADMTGDPWRFAVGLQPDLFDPRMPDVVDSVSALAAAGNPGNGSRAQLRAEYRAGLPGGDRLFFAAALSEAFSTTLDPSGTSEDNGKPNIELNASWAHGEENAGGWLAGSDLELGLSGVWGELRTFYPRQIDPVITTVLGASVDGAIKPNDRLKLSGQVYYGQSLGSYFGNVLQVTNSETGEEIAGWGGWASATLALNKELRSNLGYGADLLRTGDLASGQIDRNSVWFTNLIWEPKPGLQFAGELTWRETRYVDGPNVAGPAVMMAVQFAF